MNDTILSALVGTGGALLGVFMTLWMNQRQLKITLQEEREKIKEEREFSAKHEAFVSAIDAVIRFYHYYVSLPDKELPTDGNVPTEVTQMGVALSNLHFYCGLEAIKNSVAMSQVFNEAYAKAIRAKIPSAFIAAEIKSIEIQISGIETINNQIQQEILVLLSSNSSTSTLLAHRQQVSTNLKLLSELQLKKIELIKSKYKATEDCRDIIKGDLRAVNDSLRDALLVARAELNFPIDKQAYAALINQSTEKALASIEDLYTEIRAQVKKRMA